MRIDLLAAAVIAAGALAWPPGSHAGDPKSGSERIVAFGRVFNLPTPQALAQTTEEVCGAHDRSKQTRCREAFDTLARAIAEFRALLTAPRAALAAPLPSSSVGKSEDNVPSDVRAAGRRVAMLTSFINTEFGPKR